MRRILLLLITFPAVLCANAQRKCGSVDYRKEFVQHIPGLQERIDAIEAFTKKLQTGQAPAANNGITASSVINIPVVVHVVYNANAANISDAQIKSQIEVLNQDYRRLNADSINTPSYFQPFAADCGFHFVLAKVDPTGHSTSGIIRKHTSIQQFNINDDIKFSAAGGDDGWDADSYFNIWVGDLSSGILGYSSVVGGPKANDGIVVTYSAFGTKGTATAPFNEGRTATHETGHWLNLIHTWGDADCGDDQVADTPPQQTAEYGCPSGIIITCNDGPNGEMYTNYMDFTNDACMNIFTLGQRQRMRALFEPGGVRYAILSSAALAGQGITDSASSAADEQVAPGAEVYPNPARDLITIRLDDQNLVGSTMEIYSQVGQRVYVQKITQLQFQVSIGNLNAGLYFVKINAGGTGNLTKLVKL